MPVTTPTSIKYRSDVDGLRAIAVLSVLGFHAFPDWIAGGFVGVDIFFVISGFLISTIIFERLEDKSFSFFDFYARRVRRIFPALLLVLSTCLVFGWYALLPSEYAQLGKHSAAGAGFISNVVLWKEVGYFDNAAETKPLLHLWSLGIEEQYYFIWPLLVWLAYRRKISIKSLILFGLVTSFLLNIYGAYKNLGSNFYLPPARFWELLTGSLLAWCVLNYKDLSKKLTSRQYDVMSIGGFALISVSLCIISSESMFPGWWALLPVTGAALMIFAGPHALLNRTVLSNRLMVLIGLISFPLYLWHWPILAFARITSSELPTIELRIVALAAAFILAGVTYIIIERPVRFGFHQKVSTFTLVGLMICVGCLSGYIYKQHGLAERFVKLAPTHADEIQKIAVAWQFTDYPRPAEAYQDSRYGFLTLGRENNTKVLFIGDSHTYQYWNSLTTVREKNSTNHSMPTAMFSFVQWPFVVDKRILEDPSIKSVVVSFYWALRYGSDKVNQPVRCCGSGKNGMMGVYSVGLQTDAQMDQVDLELASAIDSLRKAGKDVYIVLDNPFGEAIDPHAMINRKSWRDIQVHIPAPLSRASYLEKTEPVRSRLINIAKQTGSQVIDPFTHLCKQELCSAFTSDGALLNKDYDHISVNTSRWHVHYFNFLFEAK